MQIMSVFLVMTSHSKPKLRKVRCFCELNSYKTRIRIQLTMKNAITDHQMRLNFFVQSVYSAMDLTIHRVPKLATPPASNTLNSV